MENSLQREEPRGSSEIDFLPNACRSENRPMKLHGPIFFGMNANFRLKNML